MVIIYKLTDSEKSFLKALAKKPRHKNEWSWSPEEDSFRDKWAAQIDSFNNAGLVEKKDDGYSGSYFRHGLNEKGLALQKKHV